MTKYYMGPTTATFWGQRRASFLCVVDAMLANQILRPKVRFLSVPIEHTEKYQESPKALLVLSTGHPYIFHLAHGDRNPDIPEAGRQAVVAGRATVFHRLDCSEPLGRRCHPGSRWRTQSRWSRCGSGKSSGARVIYFNLTEQEVVLLVAVYAKAERANMLASEIKKGV
jgi:hypothetical protein